MRQLAGTKRDTLVVFHSNVRSTEEGTNADRLMAALVAADCAGGDHRGRWWSIAISEPMPESPKTDRTSDGIIGLLKCEASGSYRKPVAPPTGF